MLATKKKVEKEDYHKIDKLSGSAIKLFAKDRWKFYRKFVLKEKEVENPSKSMILGSLCDFYLSDCLGDSEIFNQRLEEKFKLSLYKVGSGQDFVLSDFLYEITLRDTKDGIVSSEFKNRYDEAFKKAQISGKYKNKEGDKELESYTKSIAFEYFKEKLANTDKLVIDDWMLEKAKKCVESVILDENISDLFQIKDGIDNLGKTVIEWEYEGHECKTEVDNLSVDHNKKQIIVTEIKTNYEIEEFERVYLKLLYYLSAIFYVRATEYWKKFIMTDSELWDYEVKFQFLAVDSSQMGIKPIIYEVSKEDLEKADEGFKVGNYSYKGLKEIISEINFAETNNIWNMTKEAFENKSRLKLKLNYAIN